MAESAVDKFFAIAKNNKDIKETDIAAIFSELEPVAPEVFTGEWKGFGVQTGHPGNEQNVGLKWAGKTFRSPDDVDPFVVYNDAGERVWKEDIGHARLREVKYKGVVSTAMIYDTYPIIDHFRRVNDTTIVGAMDTPMMAEAGIFYFYLTKI
ncbi:MAG: hypothetical protein M1818_002981 [Claussenomyces sp. TS43310]|nr:MAG: hypothetical protein M1818_002981 [Claussenomyces sp. TS43310]